MMATESNQRHEPQSSGAAENTTSIERPLPVHLSSDEDPSMAEKTSVNDTSDEENGSKPNGLEKTDTGASIAERLPLHREILFVAVICTAQLFTQIALGQVLSTINVIGDAFDITNPGELPWLVSGYSLTAGTFILFSGRLGDVFGYKEMFLIGMSWFSVWSLICGVAVYSNKVLFIFARVLQGIGPAIVLPNGLAILGATYKPGPRKNMIFAIFGAVAPGGSILGALFAGIFNLAWWPWTFWALSLVLAGVVVLGGYAIPPAPSSFQHETPHGFKNIAESIDLIGSLLGVTGLILVNFAWNQAPIVGWAYAYIYVLLIIGILCLVAFFVYEIHYAPLPLIEFKALTSNVAFVLAALACGYATFGIWFFHTFLFLLNIRHESPLLASAQMVPIAISGGISALVVGLTIQRVGPAQIMTAALVTFTVGVVIMATCPPDQIYWAQTFVSNIITPWGINMTFPAATLILSNSVGRRQQGIAASLVNTVLNYSISLGLGFAGTVEAHVNDGGKDILKGYRGAYYLGIGIAVLGIFICLAFVFKTSHAERKQGEEKATSV